MSRAFCYQCYRAKVACLCGRIEKQQNQIKTIVLQHPAEAKNAKASAIIAELGLEQYECWVGEDFSQHKELKRLIGAEAEYIVVLYPARSSAVLDEQWVRQCGEVRYMIVIDATWRKAKKIWELNADLHRLTALRLAGGKESNYRIRKEPEKGYLSTVEGIVEGLRMLEGKPEGYQSLLALFNEMIEYQIEKTGEAVWKENYVKKPGR